MLSNTSSRLKSLQYLLLLCCFLMASAGCNQIGNGRNQHSPAPITTDATSIITAVPSATAQPSPTLPTSPKAETDADIMRAIQNTLNLHAQAYNNNELDTLNTTIDQSNLPFRRFIQTHFNDYQKSVSAGNGRFLYKATEIEHRDFGFVLATIESYGWQTRWFFRKVDGHWVLSEPSVEQVGKPKKIKRGNFTYITYDWADDVNETIISLMEEARSIANERMGAEPEQATTVTIRPIYGLQPFNNPFYFAYYTPGRSEKTPDTIDIFTPTVYHFGFYDPVSGWEPYLKNVLIHEYAHLIHKRSFDDAGYETTWMPEGLAEYIAQSDRSYQIREALSQDAIIPIIDTVNPVYKQDMMHMTTLNADRSLAYGFAYTLVAYTIDTYGGMDGFWKLARAYDKTQKLDKALQEAFGISYAEYDQSWREWLKAHY